MACPEWVLPAAIATAAGTRDIVRVAIATKLFLMPIPFD
jgi:hypothetical protein